MQEPGTIKEWVQELGLTFDDTTDVDDVEGAWLDVRAIYQSCRAEEK